MQAVHFPAPPRSESSRSNDHAALRKPTPSPLQVSHVSSPITESFVQASPKELESSDSSRAGSRIGDISYSPRSPYDSPALGQTASSSSPRDRGYQQPTQSRQDSKESVPGVGGTKYSPLATPKADPQRQIRNVSGPNPAMERGKESPPHMPSDLSNIRTKSNVNRPEARFIPRTSSLDSTMSSVSSTTTASQPVTLDPLSPKPEEIAQLIANAGSPEAVISQLLKEKKHAAAQNAQLFRLVQKQRSLMSGMKADLDNAIQEKDIYRKHLKDRGSNAQSATPIPSSTVRALRQQSRGDSVSSLPSEDELPIQRHSSSDVNNEGVINSAPPTEGLSMKKEISARPSAATLRSVVPNSQSASPKLGSHLQAEDDDLRRSTATQSPLTPVAPLEIHKRAQTAEPPSNHTDKVDSVPSPSSFAARRSFNGTRKNSGATPLAGPRSPVEETANTSPVARKGPPAPLNLQPMQVASVTKTPEDLGPEDHTDSDYGDVEVDELPAFERGRKKTREEDDREREFLMLREQESRSQSKKQKGKSSSKSSPAATAESSQNQQAAANAQPLPKSPLIRGFGPISPANSRQGQDHLSPHASLAGVLSGPSSSGSGSIVERTITISPPPLSPGLPLSPRPVDRPHNAAIPRSPRDGFATSPPLSSPGSLTQPLSPRPPRHPIPLPPHTPSTMSPSKSITEGTDQSNPPPKSPAKSTSTPQNQDLNIPPSRSPTLQPQKSSKVPLNEAESGITIDTTITQHKHTSSEVSAGGVYKGLVSDVYPDLLLPPNAIPSISIKVTSSRLKPSRHSTISPKGFDEEPVFTLGISAHSDGKQLWRVEKPIMSLPQLEQQLKSVCNFDLRLPDKSLFHGHAPAKIDARRDALEKYFEIMLDTPMNEKAALIICHFLSTHVISAEDQEGMKTAGISEDQSPVTVGPDGKVVKEGYLTKRGKQFGGWKARFFVLDDPVLRYYDAPGGSLQGTIKLTTAQIGRQSANTHHSPTRADDPESQFRHAFLILEPKKKDSSSHMKHVLCAENDQERDDWVYALLQYVGQPATDRKSRPVTARSTSESTKGSAKKIYKDDSSSQVDSGKQESFDTLQGTSYEDTSYAQPPTRVAPPPPDTASPQFPPSHMQAYNGPPSISKPSNGAVIQDTSAWGLKAPGSPRSREKEQKKRSIWGFRDKLADVGATHTNVSNNNNNNNYNSHPHPAASKNVFGIPLNEAVEYCMARGSNVPLPSVVFRCIEYLEAKGAANEEGIFRLSGSNLLIKQLKEKFNTQGDFDFLAEDTYYDVHAVASLLKLYLRELPSMVLTRDLHMEFLRFMELDDKATKIAGYNHLVHRLPLPNWTLVRALSQFLIGIVNNSHINKMSVRNVGIVFAPTLNVPAPVFASFLTDFHAIFVEDPSEQHTADMPPALPLTPEDIRSPRRQMFSEIPTPSYQQESFASHGLQHEQAPQHRPEREQYREPLLQQLRPAREPPREPLLSGFREPPRTGFIPMQPSYETSYLAAPARTTPTANRQSVLVPGPEVNQRGPQGTGLTSTGLMRDTKARRRESAMMLMSGPGARKSSMPSLGQSVPEE